MLSVSRFALMLSMAALLSAPSAFAAPKSSAPNIVEGVKTPVAKPTSAWLVGPSQASSFDAKDHPEEQGCLMVAEFDNGMIVGIHARAAGIVGMTVDTRKQTMTPGQPATLGLNAGADSYVMDAVATDASTLAVSLDQAGGGKELAERLTGLGNFRLLIDQKPYYFATTGFTDGLARMQECMGANITVPVVVRGPNDKRAKINRDEPIEAMKVETSGNQTPLALAIPNLVPNGYRFVLDDVDPMTPISWQPGDDWVNVLRTALAPKGLKMSIKGQVVRVTERTGDNDPEIDAPQLADDQNAADAAAVGPGDGVWTARKGDNLSSVLESWGMMAGVNVQVDLMGDLVLPRDVKYEGAFNDAVQNLLSQYSGRDKPVSMVAGSSATARAPASKMPAARLPDITRAVPEEKRSSWTTRTDNWKPRSASDLKAMRQESSGGMKQMDPVVEGGAKAKKKAPAPKASDKPAPTGKAPTKAQIKAAANGKWNALQGTSLRDILDQWSKNTGIRVVWDSEDTFPLPESVQEEGKFEDAVAKVLAQYRDRSIRPSAQLNEDPETGEKALIVKSTGF